MKAKPRQKIVNIHEAKTHLSRLLRQVAAGQEIVIAKAGQPLARLVPAAQPALPRTLGFTRGALKIPEDFDAALPAALLDAFEGRG